MPALDEQAQLPGAFTADFAVVRALLRKGRSYEQAVEASRRTSTFRSRTRRRGRGCARIAENCMRRKKPAFLFVNNRLEGNAPTTVEAVADRLAAGG